MKSYYITVTCGSSSKTCIVKVLSYGNDKFYLFFDDRVKPTKLNIDSKLVNDILKLNKKLTIS